MSGSVWQRRGAAALLVVSLGVFAQRCVGDPRIAFIVQDDAAPWVAFPFKPTGMMGLAERDDLPVTRFRTAFEVPPDAAPEAVLHVRALRRFALRLNGTALPQPAPADHWRRVRTLPLGGHLRPGTNQLVVEVVNATGPAMLALRSEGLSPPLVTGPGWTVSVEGGPWRRAERVHASHTNPTSYAMPSPGEGLAARGGLLLALGVAGALLSVAVRSPAARRLAPRLARALPVLVGLVWVGFLLRAVDIPTHVGFDAHHHVKYVDYLREHRSLPLATDGWMMFHPPVYYLPTAWLVDAQARLAPGGLVGWKLLGWGAGLATALLCGALGARACGAGSREAALALGFGALVPMNVYVSSYVTNESLHTALACALVLATARLLRDDAPGTGALLAWALLLAVAALTKYTAWIVGAVASFFLVVRWLRVEGAAPGSVARRMAGAAAVVLVVAGWFYARNLYHFGLPFPLNVDLPGETRQWWSQPGYYTPAFFLRFGDVLAHPYLAGYHAAWDSFYSTLWGDGQMAGQMAAALRHPYWDWELMAVVYWLAVPATLLMALGALRSLRLALGSTDPGLRALHSFLLTLAYAVLWSVLFMTLRQQDYGQTKAFYGMAGVAPLSVFFALGCGGADRWLEARGLTWARALLHGWLGALAGAIALCFAGPFASA